MGVDFDVCEICRDGNYTVCKYCLPEYDANKGDIEDEIISDSGMIFFAAKKKEINNDDEIIYTKDDILFYARNKDDFLEEMEEGIQYVYGFYNNDEEKEKTEQDKDYDYFFYNTDEIDVCFGEAYDTYVSQQLKLGNNVLSRYEEDYDDKEYEPNDSWKKMEKTRLQKKMNEMKVKLSKFS